MSQAGTAVLTIKIFARTDGSAVRRQAKWGAFEAKAEPAACRRRILALERFLLNGSVFASTYQLELVEFTAEQTPDNLSIGPPDQNLLYCSRRVTVPIAYGKT
jgi:hypothetical protein